MATAAVDPVEEPQPRSPLCAKHPAPFNRKILAVMADYLEPGWLVLDPFAGIGRLAEIPGIVPILIEIEYPWCTQIQGDATALPFADATFDAIATSPTYSNRFADKHRAKDGSRRRSYTHDLRTGMDDPEYELHEHNSGTMQWGKSYRELHERAWPEVVRTLKPRGTFLLNISDHIRDRQVVPVTQWHMEVLTGLGLELIGSETITTPRLRDGENNELRVDHEWLHIFVKP